MAKLFLGKQLPSAPKTQTIQGAGAAKDGYTADTEGVLQIQKTISDLRLSFKDKSFADLTAEDKDSLIKLMALSLNIIKQ